MVDLCEITSGTPKERGGPNGRSAEPQFRVVGWTREEKTNMILTIAIMWENAY